MRIYRWLLRLSPHSLRRDYGAAMEEMFARRMADAARSGPWRRTYVLCRELAGLLVLAMSERFGATARMRRRRQHATLWSEGRNDGRHCARDSAGGTTTRSNAAVHRDGGADTGTGDWRECVALHRRAPRRAESAAVPRLGADHRAGLRHSGAQSRLRHELDGLAALFPACRPRSHCSRASPSTIPARRR